MSQTAVKPKKGKSAVSGLSFGYSRDEKDRKCIFCKAAYADQKVMLDGVQVGRDCGGDSCRTKSSADAMAGKKWQLP